MGLLNLFKKKTPDIPPEALTWWVHRETHFAHMNQFVVAREGEPFTVVPLTEVFGAIPSLRTDEGPIPLNDELLERLGMDFEGAVRQATDNARSVVQKIGLTDDGVLIWEGLGSEAALVLGGLIKKGRGIQGSLVMMLPAEDLVLAADSSDERALTQMLTLAEQQFDDSEEFRSLRAIAYGAEPRPVEWLPPEDHPLSVRFRVGAARTLLQEARAEHHVFCADGSPLAHLAALESHGGVLAAAWARGADVVVPTCVERLILLDTPEQPMSRVDVDFGVFCDTFPHALEPLARGAAQGEEEEEAEEEDALMLRLRGVLFPTPRERTWLLQRSAFVAQSPDAGEREVAAEELLADLDGGATVLLSPQSSGQVTLRSPDGRVATTTPAAIGARAGKLPVLDQQRYHDGLAISVMMGAMFRAMSGQEVPPEPPVDALPEAPADLLERAAAAQPAVLVSNDVRKAKEQLTKEGDETVQQLLLSRIETWEPARLFPVVRPPGYEQGQQSNVLGMAEGLAGEGVKLVNGLQRASRPGPEGLQLDLVSDRGDRMAQFDASSQSAEFLEMAWRTALLNLEAASLQPLRRKADGLYASPWNDDYDFSRLLLLPKLVSACQVKGAPLVFAPTVGRVWVTGAEDVAAQAAALDAIDAHLGSGDATSPYTFRQLLFGWPWTVKDGALVRWAIPAGHPLAERIAALDAQLAKRRETSRAHVGAFAKAAARGDGGGPTRQA